MLLLLSLLFSVEETLQAGACMIPDEGRDVGLPRIRCGPGFVSTVGQTEPVSWEDREGGGRLLKVHVHRETGCALPWKRLCRYGQVTTRANGPRVALTQ